VKTSIVMDELRKIRDENSLRHRSMSNEEISREYSEAVDWFISKVNRPIEVVELSN